MHNILCSDMIRHCGEKVSSRVCVLAVGLAILIVSLARQSFAEPLEIGS